MAQPWNDDEFGIVSSQEQKHPEYSTSDKRLASFPERPLIGFPDSRELVQAGFFYDCQHDQMTCYCCGNCLTNWLSRDSPMNKHRVWFPTCQIPRLADRYSYRGPLCERDVCCMSLQKSDSYAKAILDTLPCFLQGARPTELDADNLMLCLVSVPVGCTNIQRTLQNFYIAKGGYNGISSDRLLQYLPGDHTEAETSLELCPEPDLVSVYQPPIRSEDIREVIPDCGSLLCSGGGDTHRLSGDPPREDHEAREFVDIHVVDERNPCLPVQESSSTALTEEPFAGKGKDTIFTAFTEQDNATSETGRRDLRSNAARQWALTLGSSDRRDAVGLMEDLRRPNTAYSGTGRIGDLRSNPASQSAPEIALNDRIDEGGDGEGSMHVLNWTYPRLPIQESSSTALTEEPSAAKGTAYSGTENLRGNHTTQSALEIAFNDRIATGDGGWSMHVLNRTYTRLPVQESSSTALTAEPFAAEDNATHHTERIRDIRRSNQPDQSAVDMDSNERLGPDELRVAEYEPLKRDGANYNLCKVCKETKPCISLLPCRHLGVCAHCAFVTRCPVCGDS